MRLLHLAWSHLPLRLARTRDPGLATGGPIVLGGQPWDDGTVLDASPAARELGIRRGIALGHAHRLAPEARFVDPDPAADAAAVEGALDALAAFSPGVAAATEPADPAFGAIEVQVDGLGPLWGPEPVLVARIGTALALLLPGPPRAGIAGTRFAAALAAHAGPPGPEALRSVPPGEDAAFLAPFPAATLSRDPEVRGRLARFGLTRIGDVAALPRSALVARFGPDGARLHARANGEETDLFRPRRAPERLALAFPLEPAVADLAAVRFVLRRLARALAAQLEGRGCAAGRARLVLELDETFRPARRLRARDAGPPRPGGPPLRSGPPLRPDPPRARDTGAVLTAVVEQRFPEPTADPEAIERLLQERLERDPPAAPVERLELELAEVVPAAGQQLALFVPQVNRAARLGWQLARLAVRFGPDRVGHVEIGDPEATLAEARWTWRPVAPDGDGPP
jgi:nucleotidyltransferase/DNA polymerase involved in DNA repair